MSELADALVMDRSALGHNVRPLDRDGYMKLQESTVDRRRRHVVMTGKGQAKFQEAKALWQIAQNRFIGVLGLSEASSLRATLLGIAHDARLATPRD